MKNGHAVFHVISTLYAWCIILQRNRDTNGESTHNNIPNLYPDRAHNYVPRHTIKHLRHLPP